MSGPFGLGCVLGPGKAVLMSRENEFEPLPLLIPGASLNLGDCVHVTWYAQNMEFRGDCGSVSTPGDHLRPYSPFAGLSLDCPARNTTRALIPTHKASFFFFTPG